MTVDQIEELIRKYLSTGIAVVIVLIGPATATSGAKPTPTVLTVTPGPSAGARATTAEPTAADRSTAPVSATATAAPTTDDHPGSATPEATPTTEHEDKKHHHHDTGTASATATSIPTSTATGAAIPTPTTVPSTATAPAAASTGPDDTTSPDSTEASDRTASPDSTEASNSTEASGGTGSTPTAAPSARTTAGEGTTAAATFGWGTPTRQDEFTGDLADWGVYDGPGHADKGRRSPSAATVANGVLTIAGDAEGTTGGMDWGKGQKYGRWEGRVKAPASDPSYNALMLLWPDAEDFPQGGEIDFMELTDPTRQSTNLFVHHGADNAQVHGDVHVDATQWHNWAVEWTPKGITTFVDGKQWWHSDDPTIAPPGPMHLCIQLDWFPGDAQGAVQASQMQVDWVRQYALDDAGAGAEPTATAKPATDATATATAGRGSVMRAVIQRMFGW